MLDKFIIHSIVLLTVAPFFLLVSTHGYYPKLPLIMIVLAVILLLFNLYILIFKKELYALIPLPFVGFFAFLTIAIYQAYQSGK
jgi:hypothetical protein